MAADDEAHKAGGGNSGEGVAYAPSVHNDGDDDVQQQPFFILPIFWVKKQQILTSFCVYKNAIALTPLPS